LRDFGFGGGKKIEREYTDEDIMNLLKIDSIENSEKVEDFYEATRINDYEVLKPLIDRGFELETLKHFEVGFYERKERIIIPVRSEVFKIVGFIGRAIDPDAFLRYKYSRGFRRGITLFNLQNAKMHDCIIVVEGSTDVMKIHQAGYPNVVAALGASLSSSQKHKLQKYFDKIICFGDDDAAGEAMNCAILESCRSADISIVSYPAGFPSDPGGMDSDQIKICIEGAENTLAKLFQ